jgi:excisionase family DNA binding protein
MQDRGPVPADDSPWVGISDVAERLGFPPVTIWRLVKAGDLPMVQAGAAYRLPRQFMEDAYAHVMAGGQVVLSEFGRRWPARNATEEAVA